MLFCSYHHGNSFIVSSPNPPSTGGGSGNETTLLNTENKYVYLAHTTCSFVAYETGLVNILEHSVGSMTVCTSENDDPVVVLFGEYRIKSVLHGVNHPLS